MNSRPILPSEATTRRRQRLRVMRRGLLAARDELRMFHAEEGAIGRYQLWQVARWLKRRLCLGLDLAPQYAARPLQVPAFYKLPRRLPHYPIISIVTPTRNAEAFVEQALRSVADQDYPRLEHIIQDGGSTDDTLAILHRHGATGASIASAPDAGPAQGLNRGFGRARGDILGSLSADNLLMPGALAFVAEYFERHPHIDVVYGHRILIDSQGQEIGRCVLPRHSNRVLSWTCHVPPETLFWRRQLWERAGGALDEQFQMAHHWDLLLRFRALGARFARLPRFLGACRIHRDRRANSEHVYRLVQEQHALRKRCQGRAVGDREAGWRVLGYWLRHMVCQQLYRGGWLRH